MIKPKIRKVTLSIRISPEAQQLVRSLAAKYSTSQGQIVEQLLTTYGPKILEKTE